MFRLVCSALIASTLVLVPASLSSQFSDQARAEVTEKADKSKAEKKAAKKQREMTEGQKAFRERQKRCSAEWKEARKAGKVAKSGTWLKTWQAFFSECNTRLKKSG